jgi:Domain of unknown function (DUF4440)
MIKKIFIAVIISVAGLSAAFAQDKEETAVAAVVEKLRLAMIDGNKTELENIAADKLSYGHSSGAVQNKKEFVDKIVSGQSDFVTIELKDQAISISDNTAIVRHALNATTNDNGKPGEVHLLVLLIFQKQKGEWKLLARQAVKTS